MLETIRVHSLQPPRRWEDFADMKTMKENNPQQLRNKKEILLSIIIIIHHNYLYIINKIVHQITDIDKYIYFAIANQVIANRVNADRVIANQEIAN